MSTFYENDSMGYDEIIMTTPQFATNQVFRSREDLVEWVQKLGYSLGVVVVTKRSNKRPCGFVFKVVLICDRGGKYRVQKSSKASGTKKINCPFELEGTYSDEYDAWTLTVICDGHNHQRSQYMEGHAYARRLTDDERSWVAYLTKMNVAPHDNSAYVNTGEQTYFGSTSSVIDDLFGFNQNTAEQTYFTNTARVTEYDFMGLSQHSVTCQKSIDYRTYIGEIPEIFQPYVEDIENVDGDGNCGFRATAVALGYHQNDWASIRRSLIEEMVQYEQLYRLAFNDKNNTVDEYNAVFSSLNWFGKGFAPTQYWMIMPETGYLIANRFNVIFHFISKDNNSSSTIFPLWRGPDQFPEKRIITMALVHSNHYVAVKMQGEFPMGVTQKLWTLNRQTAASEWEQIYQSRQQLYKDWIWKPPVYKVID
ncbi:uncharacterized protein LOC143536616 [Bidens hawaiensis]|uniref:uncharacterized protein LOC143536616 n=1 Tax=Bidens hawaiensis TaxID=980011 RepID=UPI0040496B18